MKNEKFTVQNVKCEGCASTIREGVLALHGIQDVTVEIDAGEVSVSGTNLVRAKISEKLSALGYPEA